MIELPTGFVTTLTANANEQIANFSGVLTLVIGLLLAILAIGALIRFFRH
jgi:uncharacterized membrane protein